MVGNALPSEAGEPINIHLGGYDGSVAGLRLTTESDGLLALEARFAYSVHIGAVRSIASSGPTLVTGSSDETVRVYDVERRVEVGSMFQHSGTVNALEFAHDGQREFLLSASDDASICVWRTSDWKCLKKLTGHQAPVHAVAVHPSARLALSVCKDRALFMWNLMKGQVAFSAKTKAQPATSVAWAPEGSKYLLVCGNTVTVSNVEGRTVMAFGHEKEVLCAEFLDDNRVVTGGENKVVQIWDVRTGRLAHSASTHESRIRGLSVVDSLVVSGDSQGGVKIWDERRPDAPRLQTSVGGGDMRLTCLSAACAKKITPVVNDVEEGGKRAGGKRKSGKARASEDDRAPMDGQRRKSRREPEDPAPKEGTASQRKRKKRKPE